MLRAIAGTSLVLALSVSVWAGGQPKGLPPRLIIVSVDKEGRPYLKQYILENRQEQVKVKVLVNGREEERTEVRTVTVTREARLYLDIPDAEVQDTNGKRVDLKKLRLSGPTPVLLSGDGNAVDPFYVRLVREGTLIVVRYLPTPRDLPPPKEPRPVKE